MILQINYPIGFWKQRMAS